jgi:hypothetical protein
MIRHYTPDVAHIMLHVRGQQWNWAGTRPARAQAEGHDPPLWTLAIIALSPAKATNAAFEAAMAIAHAHWPEETEWEVDQADCLNAGPRAPTLTNPGLSYCSGFEPIVKFRTS